MKKKIIKFRHLLVALILLVAAFTSLVLGFQVGMPIDGWHVDFGFWCAVSGCTVLVWPLLSQKIKIERTLRIPDAKKAGES